MKRIVFGITSLSLGGAERVLVDIVNELVNKYDVTIFTLYGNGEFECQLNKDVEVISVYNKSYNELSTVCKKWISIQLVNGFLRKKIYNKYIKGKYDVEIAFLEGPMTWIFAEGSGSKKIAWVHNDIEDVFGKGKNAEIKQKLNEESYDKYNSLVFVSQDNLKKFESFFSANKVEKRVIYNYLDTKSVIKKAVEFEATEIKSKVPSFVQVSRIVEQKALFRLLEVHKKLINDGLKHNVYIVGDGPLREKLEDKIKEYKLNDSFVLLGKKENPYPYIKKGDYFMLTSYYEGYPMVLLEAKSLNKYIMITDSAARETLIDYANSMIVENSEDGIYNGIKKILEVKPKLKKNKDNMNDKILEEIITLIEGEV